MRKAVFEWVSLIVASLVIGPVAGLLLAMLRAADGSRETTPLVSTSPALGVLLAIGAIGLAWISGVLGTKTVARTMGMVCAGFTLIWAACRTGTGEMIYRGSGSASGDAWRLALEGAILFLPALALVAFVQRPVPVESDEAVYPLAEYRGGLVSGIRNSISVRGLGVIAASAAGAVFGCTIGSIALLKGQCVFAGVLAGIGAGCAGGLLMAGVENPRPALAPYIGLLLLAIAGPIVGAFYHGAELKRAAVSGELIAVARLVPLDWIAGMFLGVPWGLSWVSGMVKEHEPVAAAGGR